MAISSLPSVLQDTSLPVVTRRDDLSPKYSREGPDKSLVVSLKIGLEQSSRSLTLFDSRPLSGCCDDPMAIFVAWDIAMSLPKTWSDCVGLGQLEVGLRAEFASIGFPWTENCSLRHWVDWYPDPAAKRPSICARRVSSSNVRSLSKRRFTWRDWAAIHSLFKV